MDTYMTLLKSYMGRDKVLRTVAYTSIFVSGSFKGKLKKDLLKIASQLSSARTVLRLFDDIPMFFLTKASIVAPEKDVITKALTVLGNVAILIFFPIEKVAWLADNEILSLESYAFWKGAIAFWAICLVFGILKSIRKVMLLRVKVGHIMRSRKLELPDTPEASDSDLRVTTSEMRVEYLTVIKNVSDLIMAVNWLPPGFLWADKISPVKTAFFGIISSLIGTGLFIRQSKIDAKNAKKA